MANTTDTDLTKIIVNKLTTEQYAAEVAAGTLSPNEFYILTDYVDTPAGQSSSVTFRKWEA